MKNYQQKFELQIAPVSWNNLNLSHCNQRHSLLLNQFYFWFVRILFRRWNNFETWRFKEIDVESDFLRIKNSENKNECSFWLVCIAPPPAPIYPTTQPTPIFPLFAQLQKIELQIYIKRKRPGNNHLGLLGFLIERVVACKTDPKLGLTGSKINSSWPRGIVKPIDPIKGM